MFHPDTMCVLWPVAPAVLLSQTGYVSGHCNEYLFVEIPQEYVPHSATKIIYVNVYLYIYLIFNYCYSLMIIIFAAVYIPSNPWGPLVYKNLTLF